MQKRNHFHSGSHPWPQIYRRTAGGTDWHQQGQEQQARLRPIPQEERHRELARQRREILAQMDGAGCIGWGIFAAVVALLAAVLSFLVWS